MESPSSFLAQILADKRREVEELRPSAPDLASLARRLAAEAFSPEAGAPEGPFAFARALISSPRPVAVIAEVKRRSPSRGTIREPWDIYAVARGYAEADVDALSVLAERAHFAGDPLYVPFFRRAVGRPVLWKDFVFDPVQIDLARVLGADAVLLIARILDEATLAALLEHARSLALDALVEVHDEFDAEKALRAGARLVGINHRDLVSFRVDLGVSERVVPLLPSGTIVVAESGISRPEDVVRLARLGVRAVLVGEHFMRQEDIAAAVRSLVGPKA
ncbi:MAG: indole-3-glycerol-phosphate synthase [Brockia lithotrophica]|nr:indole-3-glycerol-phosphate synthase [Brockia lithotrophica]